MTETTTEDPVAAAVARFEAANAAVAAAAQEPGTALMPAAGADQAVAVKLSMVNQRANLLRAQREADVARAELRAAIEKQHSAMLAKLRQLQAELEPAMKKAALLGDGIDAINIYLGRDEAIEQLRDGGRAPAEEPISVRQLVLSMSEEALVKVDRGGADYRDVGRFCDWLLEDPSNLDQVLPERKGVVALVPRLDRKDYGNPWENAAKNEANRHTHWLIRNGECLWLTTTDFVVGRTTVPLARDFTRLFEVQRFGETRPLEPGTREWAKAEEIADARTRHYMKVALLLQGLLDRTAVFHPHAGVSFIDQRDYDAGRVRVITDAENAIGTGRPSFRDWQRDLMARAEVGMRVIGAFAARMELYGARDRDCEVRPRGATPVSNVPYILAPTTRAWYDFQFAFDRADQVWDADTWESRAAKRKGTGFLSRSDAWVIPIDLVTVEEMTYYLHSRSERHNYLDMVPTLRAAIAVKQAEAEEEAPFRDALIGRLQAAGHHDTEVLAGELIAWYKTGNRWHRALDANDAKAARIILAEAERRAKVGDADDELVDRLRAAHPAAIAVARRTSDWVVVEPQPREYPSARGDVFATVHVYGLRGALRESKPWQVLRRSQTSRWAIAWHSEAWSTWVFDPAAGDHLTDAQITQIIEQVRAEHPGVVAIRVEASLDRDLYARGAFYVDAPDAPRTGRGKIRVDVKRDVMTVRVGEPHPDTWGSREPAWEITYSGHPRHDALVWSDERALASMRARWDAHQLELDAARRFSDRVRTTVNQIRAAWLDAELEKLRVRFVDDFGDPGLWEGHLKTIRHPQYPYEDFPGTWGRQGNASYLDKIVRTVLERGGEVAGKTVAEAASSIGLDLDLVPADLHDLRWPAA